MAGLVLGFGLQAVWVLMRHRGRLARQDEHYRQRLEQVRAVLPVRRPGRLRAWWARMREARQRRSAAPAAVAKEQGAPSSRGPESSASGAA